MDLVIKLLTELRDNMNARFERIDRRFEGIDERFERQEQSFERRMDDMRRDIKHDMTKVHLEITRDMAAMNARFDARFDDVLLDRRDMRTRLERCERDIDDLKRR